MDEFEREIESSRFALFNLCNSSYSIIFRHCLKKSPLHNSDQWHWDPEPWGSSGSFNQWRTPKCVPAIGSTRDTGQRPWSETKLLYFQGQLIADSFSPVLFVLAGWRLDGWWQKRLPGWPPHGYVGATTPSGDAVHRKHAPAGTVNPSQSHSWCPSGGISVNHISACHCMTSNISIMNSVSVTELEIKQASQDFGVNKAWLI